MAEEQKRIRLRGPRLRRLGKAGKGARRRVRYKWLRFIVLVNRVRMPGLRGVGLFDVFGFFFEALKDRNFSLQANAMAYRFFFALFPGLIFLFTLLPFLNIAGLEDKSAISGIPRPVGIGKASPG